MRPRRHATIEASGRESTHDPKEIKPKIHHRHRYAPGPSVCVPGQTKAVRRPYAEQRYLIRRQPWPTAECESIAQAGGPIGCRVIRWLADNYVGRVPISGGVRASRRAAARAPADPALGDNLVLATPRCVWPTTEDTDGMNGARERVTSSRGLTFLCPA